MKALARMISIITFANAGQDMVTVNVKLNVRI